ncbi:MAG: hypothetical protein AABX19_02770 [Nanoarchaeota archaeon]
MANDIYVFLRFPKDMPELYSFGSSRSKIEYDAEVRDDKIKGYNYLRTYLIDNSTFPEILGICIDFVDRRIALQTLDHRIKLLS